MAARTARKGFTLIELLVVIAIIGVLIALLLPAVQASRAAARRVQCVNNEMQMAIAMQNYESSFETLPPGVVAQTGPILCDAKGYHYSWVAQILPFIDQKAIYNHLNFMVDVYSEANSSARQMKLASFLCPQDPHASDLSTDGFALCNYVGSANDVEAPIDRTNNGVLFLNSRVRTEDIEDGASNTILLGEAKADSTTYGWASGTRGTLRNGGSGVNGITIPPSKANPCPVGGYSSYHVAGANFAFTDGSVKFIKTSVGTSLMGTLSNRHDGEMVNAGAY